MRTIRALFPPRFDGVVYSGLRHRNCPASVAGDITAERGLLSVVVPAMGTTLTAHYKPGKSKGSLLEVHLVPVTIAMMGLGLLR